MYGEILAADVPCALKSKYTLTIVNQSWEKAKANN